MVKSIKEWRERGKFLYKKYLQPISSPICKTGTWSCTGEQSALAVSRYSLIVLVGLQGAHTCSERHIQSVLLQAPCPGSRSLHSNRHIVLLSTQVPYPFGPWNACTYQGSVGVLLLCVCVCVCVCLGGSTEACLPNKRVSWVRIPMQEYLPSNNTIIFQPTHL